MPTPSREFTTLHLLRSVLAMLIALSLAAAPVASAWAAVSAHDAATMSVSDETDVGMDCAKMGVAATKGQAHEDCYCCDSKSKCPDMSVCLMKCGTHVIGIVVPAVKPLASISRHDRLTDPQKPPDWSLRPPAPPPRT